MYCLCCLILISYVTVLLIGLLNLVHYCFEVLPGVIKFQIVINIIFIFILDAELPFCFVCYKLTHGDFI